MTEVKQMKPVEVSKLNEEAKVLNLIDVRNPEDFAEIHAIPTRNIPLNSISKETLEKESIHTHELIYLIYRSGKRPLNACGILEEAGYQHVFNVSDGTIGWVDCVFPASNAQKKEVS